MITRNLLRALALAATLLSSLAAYAEEPSQTSAPASLPYHGDIQIDLGGVMGNNANQAGRYNGFNSTGPFGGIGEINLSTRAPWSSGNTRYFDLNGENLLFQTSDHLGTSINKDGAWASDTHNGLGNNGSLGIGFGDQGTWEAALNYDTITYTGNVIDSIYSVNGGIATLNNGLAPWGGSTGAKAGRVTSFTVASLGKTGAMQPFQTGVRRDMFGGDFKYLWNEWTFTGAYSHEHKEGSLEQSYDGLFGGMAFAQPVNYDTDRIDLTAAYATRLNQAVLQYTFSHFTDNTIFVNLPYPVSGASSPFQRSAAYSTPPSNSAHYLTVMLATNMLPRTRLNLNARIGIEKQDDVFAPNTADPNLLPATLSAAGLNGSVQGTTANSPDILATVYQLKLSATSHPITNLDTRVYYGVDGRNVSLNQYQVNCSGSGSDSSLGGLLFVVPQDWLKQNAGAEVGYRIIPEDNTKLTVGYRLDVTDRSNAQVGHSSTNTASIALSSDIGSQVNGRLSFDYASRTGSLSYLTPWASLIGPTATQTFSGAYYQAPMTSEAVNLRADYTPLDNLSGGLYLQFKNTNYTYPGIPLIAGATPATIPLTGMGGGVKQDLMLSVGPDINWRPIENVDVHLFYTFEELYYVNQGNGVCSTPADIANAANGCTGSAGYYQNKQTTTTHTVGISGDWKVNEKFRLRADYTISYGSVMFAEFDGVFVPSPTQSYQNVGNYPDIDTLMHSLRVTATYQVAENIELLGQVAYAYFHNNDWNDTANAIQGAGGTAISILTPGYAAPTYSIAAVLAGVRVRF